jgi:hypothetical protein
MHTSRRRFLRVSGGAVTAAWAASRAAAGSRDGFDSCAGGVGRDRPQDPFRHERSALEVPAVERRSRGRAAERGPRACAPIAEYDREPCLIQHHTLRPPRQLLACLPALTAS